MKKLLTSLSPKILFLVLLMSLSFSTAHGQIWNNIGSKVNEKLKKKADQKIEQKIDQAIDKSFDKTEDKIEESFKNENGSSNNNQNAPKGMDISSMFGGAADVRDQYIFDFGITYKTNSTKSKGKTQEIPTMTMWMSVSGVTAISTSEPSSIMIIDMEKETMVIIQEKEKTYMAMKNNMKAISENIMESIDTEEMAADDMKFEKIGTESILGYKCDIYKMTNDGKESKIWVSKDINFNYSNMAGGFNNTIGQRQKGNLPNFDDMPQGMMLKAISTDSKETIIIEATEVFEKGTNIKMSSYKKLGM